MELGEGLDPAFFEHMRWEIGEQVKAKNQKLLAILEVVVQRACAEVEEAMPDGQLLSALLQTKNRLARQEMMARELAPASPAMQQRFAERVGEAKLHLEKAALTGGPLDLELLQMLRVIALEMEAYILRM